MHRLLRFGLFLLILTVARPALGHRIDNLAVTANFAPDGREVTFEVSAEARRILDAKEGLSMLPRLEKGGEAAESVKAEVFGRAREYFPDRVAFLFDEKEFPEPAFEFSTVTVDEKDAVDPAQAGQAGARQHVFIVGKWHGAVPEGARTFQINVIGDTVAVLTKKVADKDVDRIKPYFPGEMSKAFTLPTGASTDGDGPAGTEPAEEAPEPFLKAFGRFIYLGIEHIVPPRGWLAWFGQALRGNLQELPDGIDHILFVLGLFWLCRSWKPLLLQATIFTLAHSVTLSLSMLEIVRLPGKPVEVAIAASIAIVAIENIFQAKVNLARSIVIFAFGLIHGLGFASAFKEVGIPKDQFVTALVGFNLGVEVGQIFVLTLAFLAVGWFWKREWYRQRIVIPASAVIAVIGLYWAWERLRLPGETPAAAMPAAYPHRSVG